MTGLQTPTLWNPSIRRPGMLPIYVLLCPLISASSLTPPRDMRTNFLPKAAATDDARDVFPTPGGPTKHNTGPLASAFSLRTARYSIILCLTLTKP
nr:Uncharacterised protein [Ipomoea batatas]